MVNLDDYKHFLEIISANKQYFKYLMCTCSVASAPTHVQPHDEDFRSLQWAFLKGFGHCEQRNLLKQGVILNFKNEIETNIRR